MPPEQQDPQVVACMQNHQDITKAYIHCMQNCAVWKESCSENTGPNVMQMGDFSYAFWKSVEWKLISARNFVFAGKNYYEPQIDVVHAATAHARVEKTIQFPTHRFQSQASSALVQSFVASCDTCQRVMECLPWDLFLGHVYDSVDSRATVGWS